MAMSRGYFTPFALAIAIVVVIAGTFAAQSGNSRGGEGGARRATRTTKHVEGELLVKFRRGTSNAERAVAHGWAGARRLRSFGVVPDLEHVKLRPGLAVKDAIALYRAHPDVVYAEPNYIVQGTQTPIIPNDPQFNALWGLHNTGQASSTAGQPSGVPGADIHAPEAWSITTGSSSVVVAVIDS